MVPMVGVCGLLKASKAHMHEVDEPFYAVVIHAGDYEQLLSSTKSPAPLLEAVSCR